MLASKLLSAAGGEDKIFVDDVFSAYTYTGTFATQAITTGYQPDLVWLKNRSEAQSHGLFNSVTGPSTFLSTDLSTGNYADGGTNSFTSTGFSLSASSYFNLGTKNFAAWTFRKAPKFFDCGTYTGNGATRAISHALTSTPGFLIVKRTDAAGGWIALHRTGFSSSWGFRRLDTTDAFLDVNSYPTYFGDGTSFVAPTATEFTVNVNADLNASGATYVWYAFAHDTTADGIIQCGSFTTDGSGNATVDHGWSAGVQFAKIKASSTTGDWEMFDSARSPAWSTDRRLRANLSNAEDTVTRLSASGTSISFTGLSASQTYIYVFIVAPT